MMTEEKYNFVKMYERSFSENWDEPAVTDYGTDVTLTYGQLAINIEKLHILFKECGIKKNDKIAVMGKNNSNWVGRISVRTTRFTSSTTRRVSCFSSATSTGRVLSWTRYRR